MSNNFCQCFHDYMYVSMMCQMSGNRVLLSQWSFVIKCPTFGHEEWHKSETWKGQNLNRFYFKPVEHWIYIEVVLASVCDFDLPVCLVLFLHLSWFRRGVFFFYVHERTRGFMLLMFALTFSCSVVVSRPQIKTCFFSSRVWTSTPTFYPNEVLDGSSNMPLLLKNLLSSVRVRLHCASVWTRSHRYVNTLAFGSCPVHTQSNLLKNWVANPKLIWSFSVLV